MKYIFDTYKFSMALQAKKGSLSIREAAVQVGVSAATLCRIMNEKTPDVVTLYACCKWLGTTVETFFKKKKK